MHQGLFTICLYTLAVAMCVAIASVATVFYVREGRSCDVINTAGTIRMYTRYIQKMTIGYGVGSPKNDGDVFIYILRLHKNARMVDGIIGSNDATQLTNDVSQYVYRYTTATDAFYAARGVSLRLLSLQSHSGRQYELHDKLMEMRRNSTQWTQAVGLLRNETEVFNDFVHRANELVNRVAQDAADSQRVLFGVVIGSISIMLMSLVFFIRVNHLQSVKNIKTVRNSTEVSVYRKVITNLNHELKGYIVKLRDACESAVANRDSSLLEKLIDHLAHSLSTLNSRGNAEHCTTLRCVPIDIKELAETVQAVLPEISVIDNRSGGFHNYSGDPGFVYALMYQISRNATVHGTPPYTMQLADHRIIISNGPGKHHAKLMTLNQKECDALCRSGELGTRTSSDQGLRDVDLVCAKIGAKFALRFEQETVTAILDFPRDDSSEHGSLKSNTIELSILPSDESTNPQHHPFSCLVLDDDTIPRVQIKSIAKKLMPDVVLDWDKKTNQCKQSRVLSWGCKNVPPIEVGTLLEWIQLELATGAFVVMLIDYYIECRGGHVIIGTDLVSAIVSALGSKRQRALIYIRSGNDSVEDEANYIAHGADGMISKATRINDTIQRIRTDYNIRMTQVM